MRTLPAVALALALLTGCSSSTPAPEAAAPSPTALRGAAAARAALDASPAGAWSSVADVLADLPPLPGLDERTAAFADAYARTWLLGLDDAEVQRGDLTFWPDRVDPDGRLGVQEAVAGGRALLHVNAFVRSARTAAPPRVQGAFSVAPGTLDGDPVVRITWRGVAAYAIDNVDGTPSLLTTRREVTWAWRDGTEAPATVASWVDLPAVELCDLAATGLIAPVRGRLDTAPASYEPPTQTAPTETLETQLRAELDAC